MNRLIIYCINLWRYCQNGWRRLWHRRVDYVRLELRGTLPEFAEEAIWWQRFFIRSRPPDSLMGLRRQLQRIAGDPHVQGILLIVRDFTPGWATAESLRDEIQAFQAGGKRVIVYLINADTRSYFAMCAANEILMPPTAYLYLLGIRVEAFFLHDALAMLGVKAEVTAVSPYKSGGDQFTRSEMSPENREQLERLLDRRFERLLEAIAADRQLAADQVRTLIDHAPFMAGMARQYGLIDCTCYEDELEQHLAQARTATHAGTHKPSKMIISEWRDAAQALRLPYLRPQQRYVAVVSVEGMIMAGDSRTVPFPIPGISTAQAGSDSIAQALRRVERNKRVAALVLHIDSPGGDAFASDLIWREVLRVRQNKPVVVSMGNVAASGGYYIAACAHTIIAQPGSVTGSIGVYALRPDISGLLQQIGVNTTVLNRGAHTGLLDGTQPLSDDERAVLRQTVFESYAVFKQRVTEGRGIPEMQLEELAGGRVWTGYEAYQHGLVNDLGGLPVAIARARALAELPVDPSAPVLRVVSGGRTDRLLPRAFPDPQTLHTTWLAELARPRMLAMLPWILRE